MWDLIRRLTSTETFTAVQDGLCMGVPYPSRSRELMRDIIIIAGVTFPVIILRFISRSLVSNKIGLDDCAVALGAVRVMQRKPYYTVTDSFIQLILIPMTIIPILSTSSPRMQYFTMANIFRCNSRLRETFLERPFWKSGRPAKGIAPEHLFWRHLLISVDVLYLPNSLHVCYRFIKTIDPFPLPQNFPQQKVPSRHSYNDGLDNCSNGRRLPSYFLSMYTSQSLLESFVERDMHPLAGVRVLGSRPQHFRRLDHNVPSGNGTQGLETGFEEEACTRIYVRSWLLVSSAQAGAFSPNYWSIPSACITSMIRLKYIITYGTSMDITCESFISAVHIFSG